MSTLIGSTGKFGTSMDCSQRMELRRKFLEVRIMTAVNPNNNKTIKPFFNQDKLSREAHAERPFYFQRGLFSITSAKRYGF